jgi:spore maturation protein CgeB
MFLAQENTRFGGLYKKNLNNFDINLVPRKLSIKDYKKKGCKRGYYLPLCYFKNLHKTNPINVEQNIDVSFVGTPYNDRAEIIEKLYRKS